MKIANEDRRGTRRDGLKVLNDDAVQRPAGFTGVRVEPSEVPDSVGVERGFVSQLWSRPGVLEPRSLRYVDAYLARLTRAFGNALDNAVRAGEPDASTDTDELAAYFTMAPIGAAACVRAESPPAQARAACRVVTSVLETHRPHR